MNSALCGGIIGETTTEKNLPWNRKKFPSNSFLYIIAKELSLASLTLCIYYLRLQVVTTSYPLYKHEMKLIRRLLGQPSQTQPFGRTGENRKMRKKRIQMYIFMCLTAHKFKSLFLWATASCIFPLEALVLFYRLLENRSTAFPKKKKEKKYEIFLWGQIYNQPLLQNISVMWTIYKHPQQLYTNKLLENCISVTANEAFLFGANCYAEVALNNPSTTCQLCFII